MLAGAALAISAPSLWRGQWPTAWSNKPMTHSGPDLSVADGSGGSAAETRDALRIPGSTNEEGSEGSSPQPILISTEALQRLSGEKIEILADTIEGQMVDI